MSIKSRFEPVEHSLEMDEALHVHARERPARLLAGLLILTMVILSALGLFGDGKLSEAELQTKSATLQYQRVLRYGKEATLQLEIRSGTAEVTIPTSYFSYFKQDEVVPAAATTRVTNDGTTYAFDADPPLTVRFYFIPEEAGFANAELRVNGDSLRVRHVVLP